MIGVITDSLASLDRARARTYLDLSSQSHSSVVARKQQPGEGMAGRFFDEKAGAVHCPTEWGWWQQTLEEVVVVVQVPPGTTSKMLTVTVRPASLHVSLRDPSTSEATPILDGALHSTVTLDDSTWSLEDRKEVS